MYQEHEIQRPNIADRRQEEWFGQSKAGEVVCDALGGTLGLAA